MTSTQTNGLGCSRRCKMLSFYVGIFLWIISFGFEFGIANAKHATHHRKHESTMTHDQVYNYLMEFGYLPKSDIETGNLRTEDQLKEAIRNLQKFGNIPETGVIDSKTRKLIERPRCGVPDKRESPDFSSDNRGRRSKRFVIQGPKWEHTDLTWSLVNQTMSTLDAGQVRRVLSNALAVWERSSKLTFREVYSKEADIQVLFARKEHGDGYNFDGPGMILAHAFYPGVGRGGDAHFDEEENWILNGSVTDEGTNFMGVAVHEFGHSLGLGHSSVENAIMFPWYQGYEINGDLPEDDRLAIQQLYGSKEKQWGPYKPPNRPKTTTSTTTTNRPLIFYPEKPRIRPERPRYPERNDPSYPYYPERGTPRYPDRGDPRRYPYNDPRYPHYDPRKHPHHRTPWINPSTTSTTTTTTTTTTTQSPKTEHPSPTSRPTVHQRITTHQWHRHRTTAKPRKLKPDGCRTHYDAISMLRRELFIFRGQFLWRIGERGLYPGYPHEITRLWRELPMNFSKVDAVYENRERKIVFFIGREYYVFNSNILERGYPRPLTDLGLPASLNRIDAAMVWGHNNLTYLYSGTLYWRLDEEIGKVELDYPRDMSIWEGVGYDIDAAFQYTNGKTYFFKGLGYWEFDDDHMHVAHIHPKVSAHKWMNCPRMTNEIDENPLWNLALVSDKSDTGSHVATPSVGGAASGNLTRGLERTLPLLSVVVVFVILTLLRR